MVRLQKFLADCGVASLRASEAIIQQGRVKVNGQIVTQMGVSINPNHDIVSVDGHRVTMKSGHVYYAFYKPRGVICTLSDEKGRRSVADFFKHSTRRVFPVGRLDSDSEGLLLVTDDGDFALRMTHPRYEVKKIYRATLDKPYNSRLCQALVDGVDIGDSVPAKAVFVTFTNREDGRSVVEITLQDGRNRQVRRMFESQGFAVLKLKRTQIGQLELGDMKPGTSRKITRTEADKAMLEPLKKHY